MRRRVFVGLVVFGVSAGVAWVIAPFTDIWERDSARQLGTRRYDLAAAEGRWEYGNDASITSDAPVGSLMH